jgi:hypothetical protein
MSEPAPTPETDAMFTNNVPEDAQILAFCERLEIQRNAARAEREKIREWAGRCQQEMEHQARIAMDFKSERDELNRQLSVALKGKRPYSSEFADETIASQVKRIVELEEKLNGWFSERGALRAELDEAAKGNA